MYLRMYFWSAVARIVIFIPVDIASNQVRIVVATRMDVNRDQR